MFGWFIQNEIPEIKLYSLFTNQIVNQEQNRPTPYPAIYIEFLPIKTDQMLNNVQEMIIEVKLHVVSQVVTTFDWNDTNNESSAKYLNLLDVIFRKLNLITTYGLPDEYVSGDIVINSIVRTGIDVAKQYGHLKDSVISFKFKLFDKSAMMYYETLNVSGYVADVEIDKTI